MLLAGTRAEAALLNRQARHALAMAGELDLDQSFEIGGRSFAPGDRVVLCRNHPGQHLMNSDEFAVDNGMLATVTGPTGTGLHVQLSSGKQVVLDRRYVERGWVDYAYALTIHKAQGVTCDHVILVGPAGLYREGIYVARSRARLSAWIYATIAQAAEIEQRHDSGIPLPSESIHDPQGDLLTRMRTSAAKTLVTAQDPLAAQVNNLAITIPCSELFRRAQHARRAELMVDIANPAELRAAYPRAVEARLHLEKGHRVRALDRDNVGCVVSIDDANGTCCVYFENDHGRNAERTLPWNQLHVIDRPRAVALTSAASARLAAQAMQVFDAERAWRIALSAHGVQPGDADLYRRAVHVATDRAARRLRSEQPEWLTTWLGERPTDAPSSAVWDDATTRIAHYRILHDVADSVPGLGPCPHDQDTAQPWQQLMLGTLEDRCWLADHQVQPAAALPVRSPADLVGRRTELQQLIAAAPPDLRGSIDRITRADLRLAERHQLLLGAAGGQKERRDWILAN